jgi:hypothetical protein
LDSVTLDGSHLKATFTDGQGAKSELDGTLKNDQLKGNWKTTSGQEGSWQTTNAGKE